MLVLLKRLILASLLFGIVLIQSCSKDDPAPKEVILTLDIETGYFPADEDIWIFISDKNGQTVDVRRANDSTRVKFSGIHGSIVTLTIVSEKEFTSVGDGSRWNSFNFESYQEIAAGTTIQLNRSTGSPTPISDELGTTTFTMHDYSDSDSPRDAIMYTDGASLPYSVFDYDSYQYSGTNVTSKLHLHTNPSNILAVAYRDDVPVYQWINDVKADQPVDISFNDFVPAKTIPINKQIYLGSVKAMDGKNFASTYIFSDLSGRHFSKSTSPTALPKLGYLDGFEKYLTYAIENELAAGNNLYYQKAGTVPASITLPDYTYSILNDKLYTLSLNFSNDYNLKQAFFTKSSTGFQVSWSLSAGSENFKAPKIPEEMKKVYPILAVDDLTVEFVAYVKWLDGYSYQDYVKDQLRNDLRTVYEELRYVVTP